jgi:hypothetical protein
MRLFLVIFSVSGPGVVHRPCRLPFILHRLQGKVYLQPVLHAFTRTRSCHADSALVDTTSRVTAQHLLQPLFVRNTALPACTSSQGAVHRHSASGESYAGRDGFPRGSAASHVTGTARGLAHGFQR